MKVLFLFFFSLSLVLLLKNGVHRVVTYYIGTKWFSFCLWLLFFWTFFVKMVALVSGCFGFLFLKLKTAAVSGVQQ